MSQELHNHYRRSALLKLAVSGALGAGAVSALVREALAADSRQGIRDMKGAVTVDGQQCKIGQIILPGQTLKTGAGGEVLVVVGDDAFMQRENSAVRFETNLAVAALRFLDGKILSVFGKRNKKLITPTATIGIRGTACYIEAEADRTYFCLCYGEAEIIPDASPGRSEILKTQHHDRPVYIGKQAVYGSIKTAPVLNHTDTELILLEGLVGRLPPFYGRAYSPY